MCAVDVVVVAAEDTAELLAAAAAAAIAIAIAVVVAAAAATAAAVDPELTEDGADVDPIAELPPPVVVAAAAAAAAAAAEHRCGRRL